MPSTYDPAQDEAQARAQDQTQDQACEVLLDLRRFNEKHPPALPFELRRSYLVYTTPFERMWLNVERSQDVAHGLWRTEALAELGVFDAQHDAQTSALLLAEVLRTELPPAALACLAQALMREVQSKKDDATAA